MKPITIILTEFYSDWEIAPLAGAGRAFLAPTSVSLRRGVAHSPPRQACRLRTR
ncbi:hypothetical protein [Devosia aurantiaca]|uniref:Uncharacterized protein n=1 Tax=Devosia aurantiaca TaxID=2714858 RepID=A0A6M1SV32_9HYPH|nr:hypothetical protein [Devosia aurantiaca]NGP16791.1 hypothetical protein [Devosia aurantiaca]